MDSPLLKFLKNYWYIIIFVGSLVAGWVNFSNADFLAKDRLTTLEKNDVTQLSVQNSIQVQLSQIQTDLLWIRKTLDRQN